MTGYGIKAKGDTATIHLYEDIGEGWFGGVGAKQFIGDLEKVGKVKRINVRINSPGGSVFDGFSIYNALARHPARIEVDIDGLAASIASVIAMAGDEIRMAENSLLMIHDPWTVAEGDAAHMRKTADLLDKLQGQIQGTYSRRTGLDKSIIADLMAQETWLEPEEAMELGFVDGMNEQLAIAAKVDPARFPFRNCPLPAVERWTPQRNQHIARMASRLARRKIVTN